MKELTVKELYTLDETIAKDIFEGVTYPWQDDRGPAVCGQDLSVGSASENLPIYCGTGKYTQRRGV